MQFERLSAAVYVPAERKTVRKENNANTAEAKNKSVRRTSIAEFASQPLFVLAARALLERDERDVVRLAQLAFQLQHHDSRGQLRALWVAQKTKIAA